MRLIVIQEPSDLPVLIARLLKNPAGGRAGSQEVSQATLEQIKRLNPHADFQDLQVGTVLLLPDTPELKGADSQSLAGNSFGDFAAHIGQGLAAVALRMSSGAKALDADSAGVKAVLEIEAVKNLIEGDLPLSTQFDEAGSEFFEAQNQAKESVRQLEILQKGLDAELEALRKMLE